MKYMKWIFSRQGMNNSMTVQEVMKWTFFQTGQQFQSSNGSYGANFFPDRMAV